jgi:hypothetical protein
MNDELDTDAQLEIGHVSLMDTVGLSKLLVVNRVTVRAAEAADRLIRAIAA